MSENWGSETFWEETHGGNWVFFSTVNGQCCELAVLQLSDEDPDFKRYGIVLLDRHDPAPRGHDERSNSSG